MSGISLAMLAAAFDGSADFFGGLASKRDDSVRVTLIAQGVGLAWLPALLWGLPSAARPTPVDFGFGLLAGVSGGLCAMLLYRALAGSAMGLVAPLTSVVGAALPVTVGLAGGDRLAPTQLAGLGCALAGLTLLGRASAGGHGDGPAGEAAHPVRLTRLGFFTALGAGASLGAFYLSLRAADRRAGLWPLVAERSTIVALGLSWLRARGLPLWPRRGSWPLLGLSGTLSIASNACYLLAVHSGAPLSVVVVLASLFPVATVVLALLVLRERPRLLEWVAVGASVLGTALLAS